MEKQLIIEGQPLTLEEVQQEGNSIRFTLEGVSYCFHGHYAPDGRFILQDEQHRSYPLAVTRRNAAGQKRIISGCWEALVALPNRRKSEETSGDGSVRAPMTGTIVALLVSQGDRVKKGQKLVVLEAMKLQLGLEAPVDGVIETLSATVGGLVSQGQMVAKVNADD